MLPAEGLRATGDKQFINSKTERDVVSQVCGSFMGEGGVRGGNG